MKIYFLLFAIAVSLFLISAILVRIANILIRIAEALEVQAEQAGAVWTVENGS